MIEKEWNGKRKTTILKRFVNWFQHQLTFNDDQLSMFIFKEKFGWLDARIWEIDFNFKFLLFRRWLHFILKFEGETVHKYRDTGVHR